MATKKTAPFILTERLQLGTAGTEATANIDLSAYVDVGDRQAILVHKVDYVLQGNSASEALTTLFGGGDSDVQVQVQDLNRSGLVFADDRALVSSMRLIYDSAGQTSNASDLYPDNFGTGGASNGRIVVNDTLYIHGIASALGAGKTANVTVMVTASIVTLSQKDFMAIAIQATSADN
jgi:hypothetical protein